VSCVKALATNAVIVLTCTVGVAQVEMVLDKLKEDRKIAAATHNIIAYRSFL